MLYELLAGAPPYCADPTDAGATHATPKAILARAVSGPPRALACGPRELVAIARNAMAREPAARYADARALAGALRAFQAGAAARGVRHRGPVTLAAVGAVTAIALGFATHVTTHRAAQAPIPQLTVSPPRVPAPPVVQLPEPPQPQHRPQKRVVERETSCDGDRS